MGKLTKPDAQLVLDRIMYRAGVNDCKKGKAHKAGQPKAYDKGYSDQYTREQNEGAA